MTFRFIHILFLTGSLLLLNRVEGQFIKDQMEKARSIDDTEERLDSMLSITKYHLFNLPDSGRVAGKFLIEEAIKVGHQEYLGLAYHYVGVADAWQGKYDQALALYDQSLSIFKEIGAEHRLSIVYNSIGGVYYDQNNYAQAMEYWQKSRIQAIKSKNDRRIEVSNNNLAVLYKSIGELDKAKSLFYQNLDLAVNNHWKESKGFAYVNLCKIFIAEGNLDSAQDLGYKSYTIFEVTGNTRGAADVLKNLSEIEFLKGKTKEGFALARKSLAQWEIIGDQLNIGVLHHFLGTQFLDRNAIDSAISHCLVAHENGKMADGLGVLQKSCECLAAAYHKKGAFEKAYEFQQQLTMINDSIFNKEVRQDIIRKEFKYEYKLKAEKDSIEQAQKDEIREIEYENELKTQQLWTYLGMGLAVLAIVMTIYVLRNLQRKKRDHEAIVLSKQIIEEKNREITDSINYAQRIQSAMLPGAPSISEIFSDYFVMYQPKDIVAGDFYWVHEIEGEKYFAVADCTGHGVPGAMMSVVCNNALNRVVNEFKIKDPGTILSKARSLVIDELSKGDFDTHNSVKDGMDISLISISKNLVMSFAGAYNSVCIVRNETFSKIPPDARVMQHGNRFLLEIKGNKQPVGLSVKNEDFTSVSFQLQHGDILYAYTDGFPDQFGRNTSNQIWEEDTAKPQGKKFKSKNLKKLLLQISNLPVDEQKQRLEEVFHVWMSDLEQIDDVCIMGVRV